MPEHIALLGDSIFDNRAYTNGDPDVVTHLRSMLPDGWTATLHAVDGATVAGLPRQVATLPANPSHLVVAIGGNDALQNIDLLDLKVRSSGEAFLICADRLAAFERDYRAAVDRLACLGRPLTLCTIYNGALNGDTARAARIGLMLFNDVILRTAFERRADVIDLRSVCSDAADYANPIEPSGVGGRKIAAAIAVAVGAVRGAGSPARVWAGA